MPGQVVNEGTPPPHRCPQPSVNQVNDGAVWRCECGRFWKRRVVVHSFWSMEYGDEDWEQPAWVEAKDAEGTEWREEQVDPAEYLDRVGWFWAICREHGRVARSHRHTRRV